jgi:serine/threonine protein kinase
MKQRLARGGPLDAAETASVGAKIAEALAAAHAVSVLHRDVKPNNILISRFGEPALADFGVSCLLDASSSASMLDVFSPQHAAPELMTRGVPSVSADVYALGSTLYELLTGRAPFVEEGRDVRATIWRTMSEPAPRPDCPGLPGLADAIERAMAKEPGDRFPDAASFAQALRNLIPDGAPSTLVMPDAPASPGAGSVDSTTRSDDPSDSIYVYSTTPRGAGAPDETMVRPDRADSARSPAAPAGGRRRSGGARGGAQWPRKPLILVATVGLLGAAAWAMVASQGSSAASTRDDAAAPPTPSSASASAPPSPSPPHRSSKASGTPAPKHSTATTGPTHAASSSAASASAPVPTSATNSSGSLLLLPGTYHRFQNAQNGDCLAQSTGSAAVAHRGCGTSQSEGWEYSGVLGGILSSVTGDFELVNEQSGSCLTGGSSGQVGAQACNGGPTQLWSKVGGSGSAVQFRNSGDGQCLRIAQAAVVEGPCGASDQADLWTEDGTV